MDNLYNEGEVMGGELSILAAIGLGILHSLEPGHGKGIMSAYLISTRAKAYQAFLLGILTACSHALSIFLLAVLAAFSIHHLTPSQWTHGLELVSGFFIVIIGFSRLIQSVRPHIVTVRTYTGQTDPDAEQFHTDPDHSHHGHAHHAGHHHLHYHPKKDPTNLKEFVWVGFLTGIIPCPSALAIILTAVGAHHTLVGAKLIIAFSLGGALTMATIGYLMSRAAEKIKPSKNYGSIKLLSMGSALLILLLGAVVLGRAVLHLTGHF